MKDVSKVADDFIALVTFRTANHLISILLAMAGGMIWKEYGVDTLFSIAALFGFCSSALSLTLPRHDGKR